jgi:hypothetical protein
MTQLRTWFRHNICCPKAELESLVDKEEENGGSQELLMKLNNKEIYKWINN